VIKLLWALLALFVLRVVGQALVAFFDVQLAGRCSGGTRKAC
jgi:hypothetical protein